MPNIIFQNDFSEALPTIKVDENFKEFLFLGAWDEYVAKRINLISLGIPLTGPAEHVTDEVENGEFWITKLPSLQLWQKYRLAQTLNLKKKLLDETEESVAANLLKFSDNIDHLIGDIPEGITRENLILGLPLENANKQLAKTLAQKQKEYWEAIFNAAKDDDRYGRFKKIIFTVIHDYLTNIKSLSIRRSRVLKELYDLIVTTDDCDLFQELQNFLTDKHRFQTGALGRSALRKNILAIFSKPKKINCKKIDKFTDSAAIRFLMNQPHGTHLSHKRYYNNGDRVFKFSHTIEVAAKDSDNSDSGKNYFVHRAEKWIVGKGAFSKVKLLDFSFSFGLDRRIIVDKRPWVVKKHKNGFNQESKLSAESEKTKICSPSLESQGLFRGKNRFKLFMRYVGKALLFESRNKTFMRLDLSALELSKVFYDITTEVIAIQNKGYFLWDINPYNMTFDGMRGRLIDHGGTKKIITDEQLANITIPVGQRKPDFLDEPLRNLDIPQIITSRAIAEKYMIYSLGKSLSAMLPKRGRFNALKNLANNMIQENIEHRKDLATIQQELFNLCKQNKRFEIDSLIGEKEQAIYQYDTINLKLLRFKLFNAIKKYLQSIDKLSDERKQNCKDLIAIIANPAHISSIKLCQTILNYLQSKKIFKVGIFQRSKLRELFFNLFHEEFDPQIKLVYELLKSRRGLFATVFKQDELSYLIDLCKNKPTNSITEIKNFCLGLLEGFIKRRLYQPFLKSSFKHLLQVYAPSFDITSCILFYDFIDEIAGKLQQQNQLEGNLDEIINSLHDIDKKIWFTVLILNLKLDETRKAEDYNPVKSALLDIIAKKIRVQPPSTLEVAKAYVSLAELIIGNRLDHLSNELESLHNFPDENLLNSIKVFLQENIIAINPSNINELDDQIKETVIATITALEHGDKLKRGTPFQANNQWYFFTHSVAVVKPEEQSEQKSFFIPSRKFEAESLSGNFGSVKPVTRFFSAENQQIEYDRKWLRKKGSDQELLQDEFQNTKRLSPSLHMQYPVENNIGRNNYKGKLFMQNAGRDLTRFQDRELTKDQLAKILRDVTVQAKTAATNNIFLSDIKPENIVYDDAKNQATIIDLTSICRNVSFQAPECFNLDVSEMDITKATKAMIFSIGESLFRVASHHSLYRQFMDNNKRNIFDRMRDVNPDKRPTFEEIINFADQVLNPAVQGLNPSQ